MTKDELITAIQAAPRPTAELFWEAFYMIYGARPPGAAEKDVQNSPEYQEWHRLGIVFRGRMSSAAWTEAAFMLGDPHRLDFLEGKYEALIAPRDGGISCFGMHFDRALAIAIAAVRALAP